MRRGKGESGGVFFFGKTMGHFEGKTMLTKVNGIYFEQYPRLPERVYFTAVLTKTAYTPEI